MTNDICAVKRTMARPAAYACNVTTVHHMAKTRLTINNLRLEPVQFMKWLALPNICDNTICWNRQHRNHCFIFSCFSNMMMITTTMMMMMMITIIIQRYMWVLLEISIKLVWENWNAKKTNYLKNLVWNKNLGVDKVTGKQCLWSQVN